MLHVFAPTSAAAAAQNWWKCRPPPLSGSVEEEKLLAATATVKYSNWPSIWQILLLSSFSLWSRNCETRGYRFQLDLRLGSPAKTQSMRYISNMSVGSAICHCKMYSAYRWALKMTYVSLQNTLQESGRWLYWDHPNQGALFKQCRSHLRIARTCTFNGRNRASRAAARDSRVSF